MRRAAILALALLLGGCASEAVFRPQTVVSSADEPFSVSGRLAVRVGDKGQSANFSWSHSAGRDELSVNTPIGTTVARLTRDAAGVVLVADGKTHQAPDVETLTDEVLGWPLPLANLVWWIRGRAAPGEAVAQSADGALLQQGWTIRFAAEEGSASPYPKRVDLARDDITIRLVTHSWSRPDSTTQP